MPVSVSVATPNGAVSQIRAGCAPLGDSPSVLLVMALAIVAAYGLRLADAIDELGVRDRLSDPVAASVVAQLRAAAEQRSPASSHADEVPPRSSGSASTATWTDADVRTMDQVLGSHVWETSGAA